MGWSLVLQDTFPRGTFQRKGGEVGCSLMGWLILTSPSPSHKSKYLATYLDMQWKLRSFYRPISGQPITFLNPSNPHRSVPLHIGKQP